jgi:diguanylate cyclase (GGDEF)-like protein/PAS domain S-box-containing protein
MNERLPHESSRENISGEDNHGKEALDTLARFVAAIEHAPIIAVHSVDRNGVVRLWNSTCAKLYDTSVREALGKPLSALLLHPGKEDEFAQTIKQIWDTGRPAEPRDWEVRTRGGRNLWVYSAMFPICRHDEVQQIFCMDIDVTERKQAEQTLLDKSANFRALIDNSADAIMLLKNGRFIDANPAALKLFGYTDKSYMVGLSVEDISPPTQPDGKRSAEKGQEMARLALQNGNHRFEWVYVNQNGEPFWAEKLLTAIPVDGDPCIYLVIRDITERKSSEQSLLLAAQVFENSREGILVTDRHQKIISVNKALTEITGYTAQETIGNAARMLCSGTHDHAFYHAIWKTIQAQDHWEGEVRGRRHNGQTYPLALSITVLRDANHAITHYIAIFSDITDRKSAEESLLLAAQVFENSREGILITDHNQRIISVNKAFTEITGFVPEEVIGKTPGMLCAISHEDTFYQNIRSAIREKYHWEGEICGQRRNGQTYPAALSITVVNGNNHEIADRHGITHYIAIFSDITERKEAEARTRYLAEHDFLTGLPSRALLLDRLGQAIASAKRNRSQLAILFIDLDRFKNINDSMGHSIGDKLLQQVAGRLQSSVRSVDSVSRQGGDEFVILLADVGGIAQIAHIAGSVMEAIAAPYHIDDYEFNITSSIGISIYPNDGKDMDTLIKNADVAMYHAKESGRNSYQFFNRDMNERIVERLTLENSLKKAIGRQEFILQYQPEMEFVSGRAIGAEALVRWQHPEFGLLLPVRFISVAEDCGLIVPIGDWVLRTACQQARSWLDNGIPMVVSVNLSVAQFRQKSLLQSVIDALQFARLEPQYLELEITEGILVDGVETTLETLSALRNLGVKLAIDDFGTGYSSLSYLKRFSIDKLKIDQSFMRDITADRDDAAIIVAIIAMAKSLNLKVIAEGVETVEQFSFLEAHGCDEYQGFYSSQALSPHELARFKNFH